MTSFADRSVDSNDPSRYAPKRIREARAMTSAARSAWTESSKSDKHTEVAPFEGVADSGPESEDFNPPPSLIRTLSSERRAKTRSLKDILFRPSVQAPILASFALLFILAPVEMWISHSSNNASNSSPPSSPIVNPKPAVASTQVNARRPSLQAGEPFVDQRPARPVGEAVPLGISVRDLGKGALVVVSGLAKGTTLSAGSAIADNSWWLSAGDLNHVMIQPPPHFVGVMDVVVELRLVDTTLQDRQTLRFKWVDAAPVKVTPKVKAHRTLAPDEVSAILKRAKDLIASGDLAAAQSVLRPAAEAADAQAAMALAETYDPMILAKLGVHGFAADVALARHWYETAKQLGSPDAQRRLEALAAKQE